MAIKKIDKFMKKNIIKVTFHLKGCSMADIIFFFSITNFLPESL